MSEDKSASPPGESVETRVRQLAKTLRKRLSGYWDADDVRGDPEFEQGIALLADADVSSALVELLAKDSNPAVAAIAIGAATRRRDASPGFTKWALRRIARANAGETELLLDAVAENAHEPVVARAFAAVDYDWEDTSLHLVLARFVRRRIELGERVESAAFEAAKVDPGKVEDVVERMGIELHADVRRAYDEYRFTRVDVEFFRQLGRVVEPNDDARGAPTIVGPRVAAVEALVAALSASPPRSFLLIGEHGAGKSTVLREALRRLADERWLAFEASAADVNAGQSFVGELEGRVRELATKMAKRRIVWVAPNFNELLWAGQHFRSPHGLLDAVLPHVEAGEIVVAGEVEPAGYELLVQQRPRVATTFDAIRVPPLDEEDTLAVARAWVGEQTDLDVSDDVLREAHDMAAHYLSGAAPPGSVLRLLDAAAERNEREGRSTIGAEDVLDVLARATRLPVHILDPRRRLDVAAVRRYFSDRVLGQPEAVECLVERIAMVKAGLTDPTRPLGVFLFVGPTGTGKTELAKTLAEFLFGSADRLVRLDMSEFQSADSLERLLADTTKQGEGAALISSVRKEPFSVVLLDEFEKAHRSIWDVFLQLFDDGRLTDRGGRTADFRHCVVILTSNLGSAIDAGDGLGFVREPSAFHSATVERAVTRAFRPELLNRLDRVVVFRPLERENMRSLLHHELSEVLQRRGLRMQPWAVEWDDAAIDFLLERGFSAELGARPLKRAIERHLLAPLSIAIVERQFPEGDQFLFISARDGEGISVSFIDPDADADASAGGDQPAGRDVLGLETLVTAPHGDAAEVAYLRRETERLSAAIDGEEWQRAKRDVLAAMQDEAFWESPDRFDALATAEYVDRAQEALRTAHGLLGRLGNGRAPGKRVVSLLAERLFLLDRTCMGMDAGHPGEAFLDVRPSAGSDDDELAAGFAARLVDMYTAWAKRRGMRLEALRRGRDGEPTVLAISGLASYTILAPENGLHVFEIPRSERSFARANVVVTVAPRRPGPRLRGAELLAEADRAIAGAAPATAIVRQYREEPSPLVRDRVRDWRTGRLDRVLGGEFDVLV